MESCLPHERKADGREEVRWGRILFSSGSRPDQTASLILYRGIPAGGTGDPNVPVLWHRECNPSYVYSQLHSWNWGSPFSICLLANTAVASHSSSQHPDDSSGASFTHYALWRSSHGCSGSSTLVAGLVLAAHTPYGEAMFFYSAVTTLKPVAGMVILVSPGFGWVEVLSYHPGPSWEIKGERGPWRALQRGLPC